MPVVTSARVAVNGIELHVHQAGNPANPTVVLCHGFPELGYSWRHQMRPLSAAGYHVLAPDLCGYGRSSVPAEMSDYGIGNLANDVLGLLEHFGKEDAVFVGHDWGALIMWDLARMRPGRVRAAVGVSVPFIQWSAPPTELFKQRYGDRFFYMLYFQEPGVAERELEADVYDTMGKVLWGACGVAFGGPRQRTVQPPMEGTGFLTGMHEPPVRPFMGPEGTWLTEADLQHYVDEFTHSGFAGPLNYYRNLDSNYEYVKHLGPERMTMPVYFIDGSDDLVRSIDPGGVERMRTVLPDFRGHTTIDGVGHWTQQEAPAAFNESLLGFLRTL